MCRSEPQIPLASIWTTASWGDSSRGSGRSSTATFSGDWKVTALIYRQRDRFAGIFAAFPSRSVIPEEAFPGLPPQSPGQHESPQGRRCPVALLPELVVETVEHRHHVVEPDLVRPGQRTPGVIQAVDHAGVDVLGGSDPFTERKRALVDHLADDPAQDQAGRVAHPDGVLAEGGEEPL